MWTKIINYKGFVRYGVQLGAKVVDSQHHELNYLLLGERRARFVFRLDRMLLNYFSNKKLINSISFSGGNFLFITSRKEYYETVRFNSDRCSQVALLWRSSAISNLDTRNEVLDELYSNVPITSIPPHLGYTAPNAFILFDNEKFRSQRLMTEIKQFRGTPLFSVIDTDSIVWRTMFPMFGNDDSCVSIYFYSFFVAHCIVSGKKMLGQKSAGYEEKFFESE